MIRKMARKSKIAIIQAEMRRQIWEIGKSNLATFTLIENIKITKCLSCKAVTIS